MKIPKSRTILFGKYAERRRICIELAIQRYKPTVDQRNLNLMNVGVYSFLENYLHNEPNPNLSGHIINIEEFIRYSTRRVDYFEVCLKDKDIKIALIGKLSVAKTTFQVDLLYNHASLSHKEIDSFYSIILDAICIWSGGNVEKLVIKGPISEQIKKTFQNTRRSSLNSDLEIQIEKTDPIVFTSDSIPETKFSQIEFDRVKDFRRYSKIIK
ncbi:hypothetical protein [Pedobacter borealis]|uniref:hypothetical protein n=1 Tax=Pedobacter borealis TaxID=475254 RepID=UPI0004930A25|nr:hypothetical protein [Pedobacter borealis]